MARAGKARGQMTGQLAAAVGLGIPAALGATVAMPHAMPIIVMAVCLRLYSIASQAWPRMSLSMVSFHSFTRLLLHCFPLTPSAAPRWGPARRPCSPGRVPRPRRREPAIPAPAPPTRGRAGADPSPAAATGRTTTTPIARWRIGPATMRRRWTSIRWEPRGRRKRRSRRRSIGSFVTRIATATGRCWTCTSIARANRAINWRRGEQRRGGDRAGAVALFARAIRRRRPDREAIGRGLHWLIEHQQPNGDLSAGAQGRMYPHAIATTGLVRELRLDRRPPDRRSRPIGGRLHRQIAEQSDRRLALRAGRLGQYLDRRLAGVGPGVTAKRAGLKVDPVTLDLRRPSG